MVSRKGRMAWPAGGFAASSDPPGFRPPSPQSGVGSCCPWMRWDPRRWLRWYGRVETMRAIRCQRVLSSAAPSRLSGEGCKSDARALAIRLLSGFGTRLSHSAAVAAQVDRVVALVEPGWRSSLEDAAWLHDVGYGSAVVVTGFHPLDGARWLREHDWPSETCRLVAWHTEPLEEARLRDLDAELVAEFDRPDRLAAAALTWADLTSSPSGERWDPEQRLTDILMRYPPGSPVHEATRWSLPVLRRRARAIEDLLACGV